MSSFVTLKFDPDERTLRQFGVIACVFFTTLGVLAHFGMVAKQWSPDAREPLALVAGAVGIVSGLFSIFKAKWNRPLYVTMSLIAYPIGTVVSMVVLGVVFFMVVGPLALVLRLSGRDALELRGAARSSYWKKADSERSDSSYFQQF